jgi:hypothetical protein
MFRYQQAVYDEVVAHLDSTALHGKAIGFAQLEPKLFDARPESHLPPASSELRSFHDALTRAAHADKRLGVETPLIRSWKLSYDIYSPKLRRFIEVDERQHFSRQRLERIQVGRTEPGRSFYPVHFWDHVFARLLARPARDLDPPHRDEARAYRDEARECLPVLYGLHPTIRLDEFTLEEIGITNVVDLIVNTGGGGGR